MVPSIIQALGIEFAQEDPEEAESRRTLKEHLLNNLRRKNLLLILDGFEHLLEGVSLVSEILHTAPDVKVLATSRIRLNISGEQRFPIAGMDVPTGESMRDAQNSDGFRLFLRSARRARPNFKLHPKELKNIAEICHLVEGNPLGIRLAAAWVEVLSPEEIAGEISQSIDLLETDSRDVPAQQRSIRAMFDHSWKLLTLQEREVFQGLSIFRGGFKREAAQKINGATLRDLRSLLNKSMLGQTLDGRYEIHELSREYAAEKLRESPDGGAAIHKRHSIYYTAATQLWGDDLKSERQAAALEEMDAEIGNIHSAWDWAVDHHQIALLDQSMEGIRHYSVIRRRIQDAETMFRQAAEHLEAVATGDARRVYARLLCTQGYFTKGDEGKRERYQQSLAVFEVLDAEGQDIRYEKAQVLNYLGSTVKNADFNEALRYLKGSLRLYQNLSNSYWIADVFIQLGYVYIINGNLDEAQKYFERSLKTYQEIGDPRKITQSLQSLPFITIRQGKFEKAERLARQYLGIYEKIGDISAIANGNAVLGVVLWVLGKFQGAHAHLEEASAVHKEIEHFENYLEDTFNLCWTKMEMGCYSQALDTVQSALDWYRGKAGEVTGAHIISGANLISGAYLTGYALSVQGAASLALGRYAEAEGLFQESITAFQETFTVTEGVRPYASLGVLYSILGQPDRGRGYLLRALEMGVEINSKIVHIFALPEVAFLLAEGGDLERATEIYALASRYPWISKSQWFQDVIGGPLATLTASLSSEVIAAAQQRGRERDLDNTVQELMAELA
jgi:predicted ATPase